MHPPPCRSIFLWSLAALAASRLWSAPADVRSGLDTLEELVGQLIRVEKATHAAKTEWQDQERQLKREDDLLRQRVTAAQEKLATLETAAAEAATERKQAESKATAAEAALARFFPAVRTAEERLRALRNQLPPLLQEDLSTDLDRLPPPNRPVTAADVGERLRLVFSLTTEIEQYDMGIHVGRLVLTPPDGTSRELEILQIGLGAAFAVSPDGAFAAKGRPGANAWEWEWQAELAEPILHALAVYRKKRPAEFVSLPLQLGGTAQ